MVRQPDPADYVTKIDPKLAPPDPVIKLSSPKARAEAEAG